ncbi:hypothetical protein [Streptomyces sp. SM14]|uniref:hypothetical protein n=1 Tax=Streptomyces sp. SM14 TaxID=1736045 RepID=UPI000CD56E22|nr:hypothetical protein [Streptomyces sp. SM14]
MRLDEAINYRHQRFAVLQELFLHRPTSGEIQHAGETGVAADYRISTVRSLCGKRTRPATVPRH